MPVPPPTRVVFLIRDLGHGGAQRQLVTLARTLAGQRKMDITVVHFYPGPFEQELNAAGVKTFCVGKRHRWDLTGFFLRLLGIMRRLRPDVIHGYLHESNLMALFLKPLCGFPKVVWGIRDSQTDAATWGVLGRLSFRLNCLFSGWADLIIANSRAGRGYYMRQGYPTARFEVVPNGIDNTRFKPRAPRPDLASRDFTVAVIGRLHPMKDHPTFLRALAQVPEVRAVVIGHGEATYLADLQALAEALGVTSRVEWQPARDDLAQIYPDFDAVISTSAYGEGFSNVLGEAMACGLPVIASDVGDSPWLVEDLRWVFHSGDDVELAHKLRTLYDLSPRDRADLGRRNHLRIEQNFTVDKMVEATGALCAELGEKHRGRAPQVPERILWITTGLGTGGAEMMLTQLIAGLSANESRRQHHVISLTAGGKYAEPLRAAGAHVHTLGMPAGKPGLGALFRLFRLAWQIRPQVIMGWMYHGCLAAVLVKVFRLGLGRVIWNIRQSLYDLSLEKRGSALVIRSLAWLAFFARTITYNSRLSASQHEAIGYPARKTRLVPNGFDLKKWNSMGSSVGAVSASAKMAAHDHARADGSTEDGPRIGRFGRYTAMKDYPAFLAAAALVAEKWPQAEFLLAGTGVDETNAELTSLVGKLALRGRVKLLGERHDLPTLTATLDVAVSSSAFGEGFPNVVGEAMACGVPVVATDIGDTAWVMGHTGRLVPAKDPEALAAACLELLALPKSERQRLGDEGRRHIAKFFSIEHALAEFDSLLQAY